MTNYETKSLARNIRNRFIQSIAELVSIEKLPRVGNDIAVILDSAEAFVLSALDRPGLPRKNLLDGFRDVEFVHDLLVTIGSNGRTGEQFKEAFVTTLSEWRRLMDDAPSPSSASFPSTIAQQPATIDPW